MGAVPFRRGLPMAPLPPLQQLGFGTSRWRLQGNATSGLRAGGRGHHLFFLLHKSPLPGTMPTPRDCTLPICAVQVFWDRMMRASIAGPPARKIQNISGWERCCLPTVAEWGVDTYKAKG